MNERAHYSELSYLVTLALARAGTPGPPGPPGSAIVRSVTSAPYNAVGDGITDDTAAIQACLNAGPGLVYFPAGTYLTSAEMTVPNNLALVGAGRDVSTILQTGPQKVGLNVIGQANVFRIPAGPPGYSERHITFRDLGIVGQNDPFYQTLLVDQGPWAAIRISGGGSFSEDISAIGCRFANLFFNIWRSDDIGKRGNFIGNDCFECGGEVNPQYDDSLIADNNLDTCWAIEATGQSVIISRNILVNCNGGISLGGSGGSQSYLRDDIGTGVITGATNTAPIIIQAPTDKLVAGMALSIAGVLGNTGANIDGFVGTIIDPTHFTLLTFGGGNSVGNGAYAGGGQIYFKGDFGCMIDGNVIDTTRGAAGIISGTSLVGCIIRGNTLRRVAPGNHGIQITATVAYFAAHGRKFQISGNVVQASGGHGIFIQAGDGHVIDTNDVEIDQMPYPAPVYGTGIGIYLNNGGGDVANCKVTNNRARGIADDYLLDGVTNVEFTGNDGVLDLNNTYGEVSFSQYEESIGGMKITAGTPTFPTYVQPLAVVGSQSTGNPVPFAFGFATVDFPGDANVTLSAAQYVNPVLVFTSAFGALTATRNVVTKLRAGAVFLVTNSTTGGQSIQIIGAAGTGAIVTNETTSWVWSDGTNWYAQSSAEPLRMRINSPGVAALGSATIDITFGQNRSCYAIATTLGRYAAGGYAARAIGAFERGAGNVALMATTGGAGPNPETMTNAGAWGCAGPFSDAGAPTASTIVWSAPGSANMRLTITNNGLLANDFSTWFEIYNW